MKVDTLIYIVLIGITVGQFIAKQILCIDVSVLTVFQVILLLIVDAYHREQINRLKLELQNQNHQ